ncbi:Ig-like domain-containing protein [Marinicella sp. W31]|uniref:Ig-like domain-containing protein n=1 Tax=Marinicella sp. W31 TaxID=3023713 RepID=UPI003756AFDB
MKKVYLTVLLLFLVACQQKSQSLSRSFDVKFYPADRHETSDATQNLTHGIMVSSRIRHPVPSYVHLSPALAAQAKVHDLPKAKKNKQQAKFRYVGTDQAVPPPVVQRTLQTTIEAASTQTNIDNTNGFLFIPADAYGAAGPNHVVNVVNTSIEFYDKNGGGRVSQSLQNFFSALNPTTFTFDPKVLYDQFEDRFLVVTLERLDSGIASNNGSFILLAVSDDANPNGQWSMTRIDARETINGVDSWLDYPGFAVDEEAVYITGNMFSFSSEVVQSFNGTRLHIIEKGVSNGFYDNDPADVSVFDPIPNGSSAMTMQPAHVFGVPSNGILGTYLVGYSGNQVGSQDFLQVIRVERPLGNTRFVGDLVNMGNVDRILGPLNEAGQPGTNTDISVNDRRTLNAVLRDDALWTVTTVNPNLGEPDANQSTALWVAMDASTPNNISVSDSGLIGGEDIADDTFTFFPSVAVNADGGAVIGFSAAGEDLFASAYFTLRSPGDPPGTTRGSIPLRLGTDRYVRTFGGDENRWGDYSSVSVDPNDACFWVYNKYAIDRGSATGSGDDGRWGTAHGEYCNAVPVAVADTLSVGRGASVTMTDSGSSSLLDNDSDADDFDQLFLSEMPITPPNHGTLTLMPNGDFSYIHDDSDNGSDQFVYQVCDDGSPVECAQATVHINIDIPVNTAPQAIAQQRNAIEDRSLLINLQGDDQENDPLVFSIVDQPQNGVLSGTLPDPTYQPNSNYNGSDTFSFRVNDGMLDSNTASVELNIQAVNDAPEALADSYQLIAMSSNTISAANGVLNNDVDVDGDTLQAVLNTDVSNGTLMLNSEGSFIYTTNASAGTTDEFSYQAADTELSSRIVNVSIQLVPDVIFANGFDTN